jgi:hydroxymethylglutaryl-CoA lyase
MGIETGLDIEALLALRADLARWLPNETLHGSLSRAGLPKTITLGSANELISEVR